MWKYGLALYLVLEVCSPPPPVKDQRALTVFTVSKPEAVTVAQQTQSSRCTKLRTNELCLPLRNWHWHKELLQIQFYDIFVPVQLEPHIRVLVCRIKRPGEQRHFKHHTWCVGPHLQALHQHEHGQQVHGGAPRQAHHRAPEVDLQRKHAGGSVGQQQLRGLRCEDGCCDGHVTGTSRYAASPGAKLTSYCLS